MLRGKELFCDGLSGKFSSASYYFKNEKSINGLPLEEKNRVTS